MKTVDEVAGHPFGSFGRKERKRDHFVDVTKMVVAKEEATVNTALMFSSATDLWETPQGLFDMLNAEFGFTIDVCATADNAKCLTYFSPNDDGLSKAWSGVCWMNPPYGREIGKWVRKAYEESRKGVLVVGLLPARTDTRWFHEFIHGKAEVRFLRGRLKFGGCKNSAPFPSMVVIWRRDTMTGTNPGAWPDQVQEDGSVISSASGFGPVGPLYTAAEMKAAKFETVERVVSALCELPSRIIPDARGTVGEFDVTRFAPMVDRNMVLVAIEKLKEEIENE